ncbi:MAG: SGNH/GDSL hydrolase family protein [Nevskiaceae bacterium]|nr:MAG: SGNH/GDSL hydrolase family protein [Nevskiaceae bacterium]
MQLVTRRRYGTGGIFWLVTAALLAACGSSSPSASGGVAARDGWVGAWAAAPYGPYPLGPLSGDAATPVPAGVALPLPSVLPNDHASDQSFRMIVHPTLGGEVARVRLSNLVGDRPVHFDAVHLAHSLAQNTPAIVPGSDVALRFGGAPGVTLAPGAEAVSDAVPFSFAVGDDLAVSFHVAGESGAITWHAVSFGVNYLSLPGAGDTTADPTGLSFTQPSVGWFFLSGVDVQRRDGAGAIVTLGDSITDGAYTVLNTRWPDDFAHRLQAQGIAMSVLNEGINSNTVTVAGTPPGAEFKGPPAVTRFGRDVLQRAGVRALVIFEGTNDFTAGQKADAIFAGIRSLVARAHAAGLCVVVGTIMPRNDLTFGWNAATMEPEREKLNTLLRAQTDIEGLADFDAVMRSPLDATQPNPAYYSPDLLHPTPVGTQVMADAVPLAALVPPPAGTCRR